ncbi:MAG: hypothetical protein ABL889_11165 [Terricaulis sp.]
MLRKLVACSVALVGALIFAPATASAEDQTISYVEPDGYFSLSVSSTWQRTDEPSGVAGQILPTWRIAGVPDSEFRCRSERLHISDRRRSQAEVNSITSRNSFNQLVGDRMLVVEQTGFSQEQIGGVQIAFLNFRTQLEDGAVVHVRDMTFALSTHRGLDAYKVKCQVGDGPNASVHLAASDALLRSIVFTTQSESSDPR